MTGVPLAAAVPLPAVLPTPRAAALLCGVGATQLVAQLCLNRGFQLESAGRGAAINVLQVMIKRGRRARAECEGRDGTKGGSRGWKGWGRRELACVSETVALNGQYSRCLEVEAGASSVGVVVVVS